MEHLVNNKPTDKGLQFKVIPGTSLNEPERKGLADFEHLRITDRSDVPPIEPVIKIGKAVIGTKGAFMTISGASKSGKSSFTNCIVAGAVAEQTVEEQLEEVHVEPNPDGGAVVHMDTEQSKAKHKANVQSILKRAGYQTCPPHYLSYNMRELSISEYKQVTEGILKAAVETFGRLHMVVIDGIADYISNVNSESESSEIVKFFDRLAAKYGVLIIVIVHTNPGSEKERGHLGSECQRKSESVISVKCENGVSHLVPRYLRHAGEEDMPRVQFAYDKEKGYHVSCGVRKRSEEERQEEQRVHLQTLAHLVFPPSVTLGYGAAMVEIQTKSQKAETTAKEYFKGMRKHGFIIQNEDKTWSINPLLNTITE